MGRVRIQSGAVQLRPSPLHVIAGGFGFVALTAVFASLPLTADTFRWILAVSMVGFALGWVGMLLVLVPSLRGSDDSTRFFRRRGGRRPMPEAYVQILCPSCNDHWEENPADLPAPDDQFACSTCEASRNTAEFMRTARDLEILEEFQS